MRLFAASEGLAQHFSSDPPSPEGRRVRDLLGAQLSTATDDAGVWRLPRGDEFYARQLAHSTTTQLTAAEIHQIGLREVARIEAEMNVLLRQLGFLPFSAWRRIAGSTCLDLRPPRAPYRNPGAPARSLRGP